VHTSQSNITAKLSYPLSYLILSQHSSSCRSYLCKKYWIF